MAAVATKIPFIDLCKVCEKISSTKGEKRKKTLSDFIKAWRDFHNKRHKNDPQTEDSFHPAMRLLLPQFDKDRGPYGIKETTLAKLYIEILNLNKESADAQKLLNYKNPHASKSNAGDFATVAYFILKNRCPEKGTLTIAEVNEDLDNVARNANQANKSKDGVKKHLLHLLRNTSAIEQKWLIRMIMKDLKFGLSEHSIFALYHPDAKDLYDVTNSLQKVCVSLRDPGVRLHEIEISMFAPFRPMLADRAFPEKIEKLMKNSKFYIETKHDGERMQLHKRGDTFKYFSRGGNEYTYSYGSKKSEGNLTPFIGDLFDPKVDECILDGEMVGYDTKTKCIGSKAENFDVKNLRDDDRYNPCFFAFDILFYNGKVLSNLPLTQRLKYLENAFRSQEGRLMQTARTEGSTKQDAADALNLAIDRREEGIVIKEPSSVYRPNTRKGGWVKLKPEYVDGLMDDLDLIIVGGYFGEGHRRGIISHFLLAVAVPSSDQSEHPTEFHTISKVGSGYKMSELYELCEKLSPNLQAYDKRKPPKSVILASGHREKPDLWIEPSNSFIVQVKAVELMESNQFKTGCTLRFPRVEKIRYDKPWFQCMTTTELDDLKKLASGKLATKHVEIDEKDEDEESGSAKKKKRMKVGAEPVMAPQFRGFDASTVDRVSQIFLEKEFCVINGRNESKQELEKTIIENGGTIVQNPGRKSFAVIADTKNLRVNNLIQANVYDVVNTTWLFNCIKKQQLLPRTRSDFVFTCSETETDLSKSFDNFGDSYAEPVTRDSLQILFDSISPQNFLSPLEVFDLEEEYFPDSNNNLFRALDVYLDTYVMIGDECTKCYNTVLSLIKADLIFNGASTSEDLHDNITHVIVNSRELERVDEFRQMNHLRRRKFHLVTEKWVQQSITSGAIKNESQYEP